MRLVHSNQLQQTGVALVFVVFGVVVIFECGWGEDEGRRANKTCNNIDSLLVPTLLDIRLWGTPLLAKGGWRVTQKLN